MKDYVDVPVESAHRMINHGPVVLVSTCDEGGKYNIAPIAWSSPVHKTPPRLLVVIGTRHKTYDNIKASKEFIVCVPHASQVNMVQKTGSVSGKEADKFEDMNIEAFTGKKVNAKVPQGCIGYLECRVVDSLEVGLVEIFVGEPVAAAADKEAFDERLHTEKEAGKTLHHLGNRIFAVPSGKIVEADES
mgnify:CR=1 FL=1